MSRTNKHTGKTLRENIDEMTGRSMREKALRQIEVAKRKDAVKVPYRYKNKTYYVSKQNANEAYFKQKEQMEENSRNRINDSNLA